MRNIKSDGTFPLTRNKTPDLKYRQPHNFGVCCVFKLCCE